MIPVEVGDRITVLRTDGCCIRVTVDAPLMMRQFKTDRPGFLADRVWRYYDREGLDWARGWYSKAVKALKVAKALT